MNAFKGFCQKRAKNIDDFLHANPDLNSENIQELKELNTALKNQLEHMETTWESMVGDLDDDKTSNYKAVKAILWAKDAEDRGRHT